MLCSFSLHEIGLLHSLVHKALFIHWIWSWELHEISFVYWLLVCITAISLPPSLSPSLSPSLPPSLTHSLPSSLPLLLPLPHSLPLPPSLSLPPSPSLPPLQSLDGFLMTCTGDGTIVFLSDTIHKHLGLFQVATTTATCVLCYYSSSHCASVLTLSQYCFCAW